MYREALKNVIATYPGGSPIKYDGTITDAFQEWIVVRLHRLENETAVQRAKIKELEKVLEQFTPGIKMRDMGGQV